MTSEIQNLPEESAAQERFGSERRRHARFDCQGHAEVIVADAEFLFRGDIRDLSLSGCYVATRARARLRRDMHVSLWFMVGNEKVKCDAVVRSLRVGKGVGFEFFYPDERSRKAVTRLIAQMQVDAEIAAKAAEPAAAEV